MPNKTNVSRWSARERLIHIERTAYWRGWVRRADLCQRFSISLPQASADFAEYMRANPKALQYNGTAKRYDLLPAARCIFGDPTIDEAIAVVSEREDYFVRLELPDRSASSHVSRDIVNAIANSTTIEIYYYSVHSGTAAWRAIAPHALGHDGFRWHARAWCYVDATFKDFVLGRIEATKKSELRAPDERDKEWETVITIKFKPHPKLNTAQQHALAMDFGMRNGIGTLRVRKAMQLYAEVYLGIAKDVPERFVPA